ncbi:MAG: potassium channel family protein [Actinomycetes bacterium]
MARNLTDAVLVVGLGRFGGAVAQALDHLGHEVLAVDTDSALVQEWSGVLTHVVQADATHEAAMRQIGAADVDRAVVGIGSAIEASVLTTTVLKDIGIREVWAKADSAPHGKILTRIGANHVIYPEQVMGERVAHLLTGKLIDFIEFDDGYAIGKTRAPREAFDKTLADATLHSRYGVTVVGVKRPGTDFANARPETEVHQGDLLIVSGRTEAVERFAAVV